MKKLILSLVATLALTASVFAQAHNNGASLVRTSAGVTTLTIAANTTTNLPSTVYSDVPLWVNKDGSTASIGAAFSCVGTNAAATNIITFTLRPVLFDTKQSSVASQTIAVTNTGTTAVTTETVLSSAFTRAKAVRLVSVAVDNTGAGGSITITPRVIGFGPP